MTEMHGNCGSRNACCSISKVEIVSLAFKWLIVLRLAIKPCDQTHRVLQNCLPQPKACFKYVFTCVACRLFCSVYTEDTSLLNILCLSIICFMFWQLCYWCVSICIESNQHFILSSGVSNQNFIGTIIHPVCIIIIL